MSDDPTTQAGTAGAPSESATYRQMLDEVESLCRDVAAPDLDLDELVRKIERGYGLIKTMRARLEETRGKIEHLRLEME